MPHRNAIATRFSRASETYSAAAAVQRELVDDLVATLPDTAVRILEIGCGTGILTESLLKKYPHAHIDAVDIAAGMVAFCRKRFASESRVQWHVCDILDFEVTHQYDLIVSSSAIHWVVDLDALFNQLKEALVPAGQLAFSLMLENTFHELRESKATIFDEGRIGGRLPSYERVLDALDQAGLKIGVHELLPRAVSYASAMAFFRDLNAQGVTSGKVSRAEMPLTRSELSQLALTYEQLFACAEGGVTATYECGLFLAQ